MNTEDGITNAEINDMFNSDNGNENDNGFGVRPVASINCGCTIINCTRDNIETNCVLSQYSDKLKIDKFVC